MCRKASKYKACGGLGTHGISVFCGLLGLVKDLEFLYASGFLSQGNLKQIHKEMAH